MARAKKFYYEALRDVDVPYIGPDPRKERWIQRGKILTQPDCLHSIRVGPSRGLSGRGDPYPPDYIATEKPIGKAYTEKVIKHVSRYAGPGRRKDMVKESAPKFRLIDPEDVTDEIRRTAMDFEDKWGAALFLDGTENVTADKFLGPSAETTPEEST